MLCDNLDVGSLVTSDINFVPLKASKVRGAVRYASLASGERIVTLNAIVIMVLTAIVWMAYAHALLAGLDQPVILHVIMVSMGQDASLPAIAKTMPYAAGIQFSGVNANSNYPCSIYLECSSTYLPLFLFFLPFSSLYPILLLSSFPPPTYLLLFPCFLPFSSLSPPFLLPLRYPSSLLISSSYLPPPFPILSPFLLPLPSPSSSLLSSPSYLTPAFSILSPFTVSSFSPHFPSYIPPPFFGLSPFLLPSPRVSFFLSPHFLLLPSFTFFPCYFCRLFPLPLRT